jgi:predicted Zn-dependent protease
MQYLDQTKQSARGLLSFLELLSSQELLVASRQDPYLRTHPLSSDRIQALAEFISRSPYSDVPVSVDLQRQHQRLLAKLRAFLEDPQITRGRYPETDQSEQARYARAIALHRASDFKAALATIDRLIAEFPADPYYYELKGQMLFETGKPREAVTAYSRAATLLPESPMIRLDLARAQMATEDKALLPAAIDNLKTSLAREPNRPFVWRQLATALGRDGQAAESSLALAEEAMLLNKPVDARYHAGKAERMLPTGSPGWLKAQDIIAAVDQRRDN